MSETELPVPPATFEFLVMSLRMQAEMAMGLINLGPGHEGPPRDLRVARHSIDLLALISEKTRGNLTLEEQRLIENSLTELRFRYVQAMEKAAQEKSSSTIIDAGSGSPGGEDNAATSDSSAEAGEGKASQ